MPGYNHKSRRYVGPRVSYGLGGAALKFGANLVDNFQSGKRLGSGLFKGSMKGVGKAAVTPGSGFAAAGDLVGGLTQNAKNPLLKNIGQAVDTATNFLPGGGGVRQTVKDVAGYMGNNQQVQGNAPLTQNAQGQQGGFMSGVNNFVNSPVGQNLMGQGQQGGLLNTAMNLFSGAAGQAVPRNNSTMNNVKLMKRGGYISAQGGLNTNGANGGASTEEPVVSQQDLFKTYFGRPQGLNTMLYVGAVDDPRKRGDIKRDGEYGPGAFNFSALDREAVQKLIDETMMSSDLVQNLYNPSLQDTDDKLSPFTMGMANPHFITSALRANTDYWSGSEPGVEAMYDYFPLTEEMKKQQELMAQKLGGLEQFQHKGKRFQETGLAGFGPGLAPTMSPDILGYYTPEGSAAYRGMGRESLADVALNDPRVAGFSEAVFKPETIANALGEYKTSVPPAIAEAIGAPEDALFSDLNEDQRLQAAKMLGDVPMFAPQGINEREALQDMYDLATRQAVQQVTGLPMKTVREMSKLGAYSPNSGATQELYNLFYPELTPSLQRYREAVEKSAAGRQSVGGRAPISPRRGVKVMRRSMGAGGYSY